MEVCVYHALDSINEINRKMPEVTLRDMFAIHAMSSLISDSGINNNLARIFNEHSYPREDPKENPNAEHLTDREWIARASYLMADTMVEARKKKKN